ncbi:MAG TPA: tRNA (adenosine(37)-N6)-threonylcarbamoyltransferase complex ATPase subunit type 1 TsaE [Nitrospiraceae bacterium]|nr:MAG: tRNA (adenosine(37)-N6)-threonylcarbamoyltransferase complex ATPase subunit type 1 TsaE [Nitrospirae bacterium GWD2_57_8]HAS55420.1 tRNA (adenosine(37)-N6)-threonylcarbamoyltransferase complex ATPase subunit type 1 TsaE [Nitrospiraceae bacterium]
MFSVVSPAPERTERIGELLGRCLGPGDVVCLYGDLGAGKTSFSYGIAMGLDVREKYITSPTFTFVNEYEGRVPFYHIDLYRLKEPSELEGIGFEEYIDSDGVTVIEWAERADEELPPERLSVYLSPLSENSREIGFLAEGARYESLLDELKNELA